MLCFVSGVCYADAVRVQSLSLKDEGTLQGSGIEIFDCTGTGIACTRSGATAAINVDASTSDLSCTNCVALATETTGNYVADITAGNYLDVSGGGAENATITMDFDPTEIGTLTWGAAAASYVWTIDLAGTDLTWTLGSNLFTFGNPIAVSSGASTGSISVGSAGVVISDDGDGMFILTGAGNGSDMNLKLNLDDTAGTAVVTSDSATPVTLVNFSSIALSTTTLETGQGANELYDMDQNVLTTSNPTWAYNILTARAAVASEGSLWNDSTQQTIGSYTNGITEHLVGNIFSSTADATITTTGAQTAIGTGVGTLTLPANFFVAGKTVHISIRGVGTTDGSAGNVVILMKLGSTAIFTTESTAMINSQTNEYWQLDGLMTCRTTGGTGTVMGHLVFFGGVSNGNFTSTSTAVTIDTTASQVIDVTINPDNSGNTLTSTIAYVEILN